MSVDRDVVQSSRNDNSGQRLRAHKSEGILQKSDDMDTQHSDSTSKKIKKCRSNNKTNTEYTSMKVYYSKVMTWIHNMTIIQV